MTTHSDTTTAAGAAGTTSGGEDEKASLYQLKERNFAAPRHYDLLFEPKIDEKQVITSQKIIFDIISLPEANGVLYLNTHEKTKIEKISFGDKSISHEYVPNYKNEVFSISIPELSQLKIGDSFELSLLSKSQIFDDLLGIYLSNYTTPDGEKERILTTQFESTYARRAFICCDEPSCKATFSCSFKVDSDQEVISNTKLQHKTLCKDDASKSFFEFEITPILSTYLLGFAIGKFEKLQDKLEVKGQTIDIDCIGPYKIDKADLEKPLLLAKEHLRTLIEYFGTFPRDKVSHIGIPDFGSGAMENDGFITYRDSILFANEKSTKRATMFQSLVIAHELAHHWFGNHVTMKWWDDLWLNESFATAVEYFIAEKTHTRLGDIKEVEPAFDFSISNIAGAMMLDSKKSTHPIHVVCECPSDAETIFDEISYNKGSTVLKQLICHLGEEKFFEGIRAYLKKYAKSNATGDQLWEVLKEVSGEEVPKMMNSWITVSGFPCISYKLDGNNLVIEQNQYQSIAEPSDKLWYVPINFEWELEDINGGAGGYKRVPHSFLLTEKTKVIGIPEGKKIKSIRFDTTCSSMTIYHLDEKLNDLLLSNFYNLTNVEKAVYFRNIRFLLKSVKIAADKSEQTYHSVNVEKVIKDIESLDLAKTEYASYNGIISVFNSILHIVKCVDAIEGNKAISLYNKVNEWLLSYVAEKLHQKLNLNYIDEKEFIPYNYFDDLAFFLVSKGDVNANKQFSELYDKAENSGLKLDERQIKLAYLANMSRIIKNNSFEDAKDKFVEILKKISQDQSSRHRIYKYAGTLHAITPDFIPAFGEFYFSDKLKEQDSFITTRSFDSPQVAEAFLDYCTQNISKIEAFNHQRRISIIKSFRSCATQSAINKINNLMKTDNPLSQDRIFDETIEFVLSNKTQGEVNSQSIRKYFKL